MSSNVFKIEEGKFGLALVDKAAVGYQDTWQSPGGKDAHAAAITDYATGGGDFSCQITSGALSASPQTGTDTTPATFCGPEENVTTVGVTQYTVDTTFLQDPNLVAGINRFLFEHDTEECYFYLGLDGDNPPKAIGRCRAISGTIGGAARTTLTATLSLPCTRKPDIDFGNASAHEVIEGGGGTATGNPTGVTPGTPGDFVPSGAVPANLAALQALGALGETTAWTTGQYVSLGDASSAHWDGDSWASGTAP